MTEPVLIEAMGDSVNLRILNFFIENPFDSYSILQISRLVNVSRNSVYKYLPEFEEKEYLIKEKNGSRDNYRLNRSNKIIGLIDSFVVDAGNTYIDLAARTRTVEDGPQVMANVCTFKENRAVMAA